MRCVLCVQSVKCVLKVYPQTQVDLLLDLGGVSSVSFDLKVCPQVGVSCCFSKVCPVVSVKCVLRHK